jgi:hypothetical protein
MSASHTAFRITNEFTACAGALKFGFWPGGGASKGISVIGTPGGNLIDMATIMRRGGSGEGQIG